VIFAESARSSLQALQVFAGTCGATSAYSGEGSPARRQGYAPKLKCGAEIDMSALMRFWRDETATTAIEYGLIAFGISVVIVAAVNSIGTNVKNMYTNVSGNLANAGR
jgi:pilus assembly protein Flp/PilA